MSIVLHAKSKSLTTIINCNELAESINSEARQLLGNARLRIDGRQARSSRLRLLQNTKQTLLHVCTSSHLSNFLSIFQTNANIKCLSVRSIREKAMRSLQKTQQAIENPRQAIRKFLFSLFANESRDHFAQDVQPFHGDKRGFIEHKQTR